MEFTNRRQLLTAFDLKGIDVRFAPLRRFSDGYFSPMKNV
jgi:hypothetical protein